MSKVNEVVEAVMDLIDGLEPFSTIRRGALGTESGLTCEVAASFVDGRFLDKNASISLDLTINGKHRNLQILSETLDKICDELTRRTEYPSGSGWEITDITHGAPALPTVIGREDDGQWLMAASLGIKYYRKDDENE